MPKIRKLPSGNYNTVLYLGKDADGKQIRKSVTGPDRASVRRKVAQIEAMKDKEAAPMLCDAIEAYIDARGAVLSPYSVRGYRNILRVLERMPCARVACDAPSLAFQNIINEAVMDGKSPKTVRNYCGLITAAVKAAGYTAPSLTMPQKEHTADTAPDEETMKKVLAAAKGTELEVPIALGMMGLRRGEVCAVTADDLKGNTLHISKAAVQIDGVVSVKAPKTFESDRYIQIPPGIARRIRKEGRATDLSPSMLSDRFFSFLKRNGFDHFRFHDLRHFFASYCHSVLKLSDAQIQKLGGWRTDHIMKRVYIQSMKDEEAAAEVAKGMSSFL